MNKYFSSIRYNLASQIPNPPNQSTEYLPKFNFNSSLFFNPVSPSDIIIELELMTTPINKAYRLYSFPTRILRSAKHIISQPLSLLIYKSLENGVYRSKLKLATVFPIYKSAEESSPSNYRPISLLSVFNRTFEKNWRIIVLSIFLSNTIYFMIHNIVFVKRHPLNMLYFGHKLKLTRVQICTQAGFLCSYEGPLTR